MTEHKCKYCGEPFVTPTSLYAHIEANHYDEPKPIECELSIESDSDVEDTQMKLNAVLQELSKQTDKEYVSIRMKPIGEKQHEANDALRELARSGNNE